MFGFLNLYKPQNFSSRTITSTVYREIRPTKVGHTGTLDPLATGVLVNAIGPATRLSRYLQDAPKRYRGSFRLGVQSDTEDVTGKLETLDNAPVLAADQLTSALSEFRGPISQVPPQFSALKVDGVRAYKLARRGEAVELKSRSVEIYSLTLTNFDYPNFELDIQCSGGTYVRSLGRDIARSLGSEAIMTALERTEVGVFTVEHALRPENLTVDIIRQNMVSPQTALQNFVQVRIEDAVVKQLENAIPWQGPPEIDHAEFLAIDDRDRLIAVMKKRGEREYTPALNFSNYWKECLP